MTDSIFDNAAPQGGEFKKFTDIGDEVQGTYIDVQEGMDGYGNEQMIYVLKDKENKIWNVGFKKTNTVILGRMAVVRLGQIIGFRYEESRPSKKIEGANAKIIRVYHSPNIVDQPWLDEQEKIKAQFGGAEPPKPASIVAPPIQEKPEATTVGDGAVAVQPAAPESETVPTEPSPIEAIRKLAITQGLITPDMEGAAQDIKIVEYTGISLDEANYTATIMKLTGYKK